jgi:rubrerythrin
MSRRKDDARGGERTGGAPRPERRDEPVERARRQGGEPAERAAGQGGEPVERAAGQGGRPVERAAVQGGGAAAEAEAGDAGPMLSELELLMALAQLDLESALAYEAAAELVRDEEIEQQLRAFARDHRRHVDAVGRLLEADGGAGLAAPPSRATGLLSQLARLSGPLGPEAIVLTLLANEQLTNLGYEDALAYEWGRDREQLLQQFRADEERHMMWLSDRHDLFRGRAGAPAAMPP